ncbi:MAG: hypothetical protein Q7T36_09415 [Fluviicoccus sp.]|uniref:hypothetical protein n=1 Tax=Fluviicoccus sp. TaxID=2003552 RepID=UPI0027249844|nr:hypothetical protein [Fluviicoccus sp.]MDO8330677.1 hypothetical protein [Fluviicoccus sp.]
MKYPELPLKLSPASNEARDVVGFKYAGGNVGQRSKLGGDPDWIQGEDVPGCTSGNVMTFYGQLDSAGDSMCLADCGIIYVFICLGCYETRSVFQSN